MLPPGMDDDREYCTGSDGGRQPPASPRSQSPTMLQAGPARWRTGSEPPKISKDSTKRREIAGIPIKGERIRRGDETRVRDRLERFDGRDRI